LPPDLTPPPLLALVWGWQHLSYRRVTPFDAHQAFPRAYGPQPGDRNQSVSDSSAHGPLVTA